MVFLLSLAQFWREQAAIGVLVCPSLYDRWNPGKE
jgi:hypothetical protein